MTKTIIQVADFGSVYSGNFVASLRALERRLQRDGLQQVLVLSQIARDRDWVRELHAQGTKIHLMPTGSTHWTRAHALADIVKRERGCLLHTHFTTYDVPAWWAQTLLRRSLGLVWHVHSAFPVQRSAKRMVKDVLKYRLMGRSAHAVAVSSDLEEALVNRGLPANRCHYVPNGIDISRLRVASGQRKRIRNQLGVDDDTKLLLMFGWEPVTKGVDVAVAAVEELVNAGQKVALVAVGRAELREFIAGQFGDHVPRCLIVTEPVERVSDLYAAADVFVSASRWEGMPYSVGEAMACQLPAVISDIRGLDWARHSPGVISFTAGDSTSLAQAVQDVLAWDAETKAARVTANKRFITERFSMEAWAESITQIYRGILTGSG